MLIVLLPQSWQSEALPESAVYWWRLERDGRVLEQGQDVLADLNGRFAGERLRALAPPELVTLYRVSMPVRRAAAVRAALPFALEDHLSQELDDLHCVAGPRRTDDRVAAAVIDRQIMQTWQVLFGELGWRLEALLPLASLHDRQAPERGLRIQPSPWPGHNSQVLVTSADEEPVLIETGLLAVWLQRRLELLKEDGRTLELVGIAPEALGLGDLSTVEVTVAAPADVLAAALQQAMRSGAAFNLLTGPYTSAMTAPPWRKLRPLLIAASVMVVLLAAQLVAEWRTLSNERERLIGEIDSLFERSLPNSRLVEPVTQFRQALAGGQTAESESSGMGPLLHEVLSVVRTQDGAQMRQFRASPTELEIELQLRSFADLEAIRAELGTRPGLTESLQGADSGSEGVTARLKVIRSNP